MSVVLWALTCAPIVAFADTSSHLQEQIRQHSAQIAELDKEIAQYQRQLSVTSAKKQTLQNQLAQLSLSIKTTTASIERTKKQISSTELQIEQLGKNISKTQGSIDSEAAGLGQSIRTLAEQESRSFAVHVLSDGNMAALWNDIAASQSIQNAIRAHMTSLKSEKQVLTDTKVETEEKRAQLVKQKDTLLTQQGSLNATKQAQSELLAQTKSQESTYQAIIAQKKAQEAAFEMALNDLQEKLRYTVDPSKITSPGRGILRWPLDDVRITQYFGNTAFAASGAYNGKGHNGMDFAAPIGTPIRAALSGTVVGTGNTDTVKGCYSFGKWVFVRHNNGLGTMYAHFSQISVKQGDSVSTGQVIGYSGETGYATGPHLHFGVYVALATQIMSLGSATQTKTPCANATMPVVPLSGYLNPQNYLPSL